MDISLIFIYVMGKALKDRLKDAMEERKISFPKLSIATGIPADRMYKWYKQDTLPKAEDATIIEKWLSGVDIYPKGKADELSNTDAPLLDTIINLSYSSRKTADGIDKMADANLINARSIDTLLKLLAANLNVPALKGLSLEDLQKGDIPIEAFLGGQSPVVKGSSHGNKKQKTGK